MEPSELAEDRTTGTIRRPTRGCSSAWQSTSFATRGSRVQIPSAPLNALVRAIPGRTPLTGFTYLSSDALQPLHRIHAAKHLAGGEVLR